MRQISRIIKLPRSSVRRIAKKNLNLKCYRLVGCPNLNENQMRKRLLFARWWRKSNKTIFHRRPIFFSDEKMFTMEGGKNRKNSVVYSDFRENANKRGIFK